MNIAKVPHILHHMLNVSYPCQSWHCSTKADIKYLNISLPILISELKGRCICVQKQEPAALMMSIFCDIKVYRPIPFKLALLKGSRFVDGPNTHIN